VAFFRELRKAGIKPDNIPTMSFSISEAELSILGTEHMVGDYASWNYFQSLDTVENKGFVERFKKKFGNERSTDDPMEAGYFGVYLWAQAVTEAGTDDVHEVRKALVDQSLLAPEGLVSIDFNNNHTWKTVRIGKIKEDGQFDIVWNTEKPIRPAPYPISRSKSEWNELLQKLYTDWGKKWENPGE
jgi:urea transport system substrate-binding protein